MWFRRALALVAPALLVGLSACPPGLDDPEAYASGCPAGFTVEGYFLSTCASGGCHEPASLATALDLQSEGFEGRLIGVSAECRGRTLVVPGRPDESYLYVKLLGDQPEQCGGRMPQNGAPATPQELACVRRWIAQLPRDAGSDADSSVDAGSDTGAAP